MCMLNVGQALKNERLAQNKTQREWIRDIHISVSRYSEIENGIIKNGKKADIGSEQLIWLLESNNVDVRDFFQICQKALLQLKSYLQNYHSPLTMGMQKGQTS